MCCQYVARFGPGVKGAVPSWFLQFLVIKAVPEEQTWAQALSLSVPYGVLCFVFGHDLLRCRRCRAREHKRLKLSQVLFERHFGIHGTHYLVKVAVLQLATILLQAFGKLSLLAGIVTFAMQQQVLMLPGLKLAFWLFWGLLSWNAMYPTILFLFPDATWARYGAACMDVALDLGYTVSYMLLVVLGISELDTETSVKGNFGQVAELGFSTSISPAFAFPSDILKFLAVYMTVAHICCCVFCASFSGKGFARRCLILVYSPALLLLLALFLTSSDFYPGHSGDFRCFPCRCSQDPAQLQSVTSARWNVTVGPTPELSCTLHADGCISSTSYPMRYPNNDFCRIQVHEGGWHIHVQDFETEGYYDKLTFNSLEFSGFGTWEGPRGMVPRGTIEWRSAAWLLRRGKDSSGRSKGWRICLRPPVRLESCSLAAVLRQAEVVVTGFDLIAEGAFDPLGCHVRRLSLTNGTLSTLPFGRFRRLACLRALDLGKGLLATLEQGAFEGLADLRLLSLSQNKIKHLSDEHLRPLANLEELYLCGKSDEEHRPLFQGNELASLPSFSHNPHLEVLDASECRLTGLESNAVAHLRNLKVLDLGSNKLRRISSTALSGLGSLQNLTLGSNRLASLPERLFHGLDSLRTLELYNNQLASLSKRLFHGLGSLQTLDLDHNDLASLPVDLFHGLDTLQTLDLHSNWLASLPLGLFRGLDSLQRLYLDGNQLASLPLGLFRGLDSLETLHLDGNELASLPVGLFQGLDSLQMLELQHNELASLPVDLFHGLDSLQTLDLAGNQLASLPLGLFRGLDSLQNLWLDDNSKLSWSVRRCVEAALSCEN
ncbi:Lrrc15, partial [Symbiodinium necroappetens]